MPRKINMKNDERACRAQMAVDLGEEGGDSAIVDLLANLRHLCDREGLDFAELDSMAYIHYITEA